MNLDLFTKQHEFLAELLPIRQAHFDAFVLVDRCPYVRELCAMPHPSVVYFVQADPGEPVKIGVSNRPWERLGSIASGYPFGDLKVVGLLPGDRKTEQALHVRFADAKMRREWFRPTRGLIAFIKSTASFDVWATLNEMGGPAVPPAVQRLVWLALFWATARRALEARLAC